MNDLYARLGLKKDASVEDIRKAYRGLSKTCHPDAGGTEERFAEIKEAHDILTDEQERAFYDQSGIIRGKTAEGTEKAAAMNFLAQVMSGALQHMPDLDNYSLTVVMGQIIDVEKKRTKDAVEQITASKERLERASKKLTFKGDGENILGRVLQSQIDHENNSLEQCNKNMRMIETAAKMLGSYEYKWRNPHKKVDDENITFSQFARSTFHQYRR